MVNFLRVDPDESVETMRLLAEELLLSPMPDPWCEFYEGLYGGMFFHNKMTKITSWHHPLEAHFAVTCERLKRLNDLAKSLRSAANVDAEVEAKRMETRRDNVHTMHAMKLKAFIDAESVQMKEIRAMRFIRAFRVHAQNKADEDKSHDVLLLEKVTKILGTSGPSIEEQDANSEPPKKTAAKWSRAMKKVKLSAAATLKAADEAGEAEAAKETGGEAPAKTISRTKSQPHDFNSTQLAQWRILTQYKTSSVGESAVRAEAAELIGPRK
jgi:hypothetical protein